jgi:hypothetical protein
MKAVEEHGLGNETKSKDGHKRPDRIGKMRKFFTAVKIKNEIIRSVLASARAGIKAIVKLDHRVRRASRQPEHALVTDRRVSAL